MGFLLDFFEEEPSFGKCPQVIGKTAETLAALTLKVVGVLMDRALEW